MTPMMLSGVIPPAQAAAAQRVPSKLPPQMTLPPAPVNPVTASQQMRPASQLPAPYNQATPTGESLRLLGAGSPYQYNY
jgi:hypothetical protein